MKKTIKENFRVEVIPDEGHHAYEGLMGQCEDIRRQIKRHIDGYEDIRIEWDTKVICEFCGSVWEEEWDTELPFCCEKAQEEFKATREKK